MGEPGQWPHVSSSFGAIDLAGFPKPPAWFYRSKASALVFSTAHLGAIRGNVTIIRRFSRPIPFSELLRCTMTFVSLCVRVYFYLAVAQWLSNVSEADAGRPPLSNTGNTVRIVENWEASKDPESSTRTIHVYTNAPLGERTFASPNCLSPRPS
jgi:hypothetical protein